MREATRQGRVWKLDESERRSAEARIQCAEVQNQPTLRAFVEWLATTRGLKRSTITLRIHRTCEFVDAITTRAGSSVSSAFRAVTAQEIEDFFIEFAPDHGPATRRSMQAAMRLFLRFAKDCGWVGEDIVDSVPSLTSWRLSGLPRGLSDEELAQLLASPFEHGACPRRDWAIVCLLATFGVRRGQISALRLEDLDWENRSIEFAPHKGGRAVLHSLTDRVAEAVAAYLLNERPPSDQGWVFLRHVRPYERLSPAAITERVRTWAIRRELRPIGPHVLRHTFASRLLRGGQSMKTIADLLGHRSLASVGLYAKVDVTGLAVLAEPWPEVGS